MIEISDIKKSGFSYEDVTDLMHESFNERLSQGLQFTCSAMTASSYGDRVKDGITLVAIDSEPFERKLIGTATLHIRKKGDIAYAYHEYLAISPDAKRMGIATMLLNNIIEIANSAGCRYILSDTAVKATSSVKWHKTNGFYIIAKTSYFSTNYYSYIFRLDLSPISWFAKYVQRPLCYIGSAVKCHILYNANGEFTLFGKLYSTIRKALLRKPL